MSSAGGVQNLLIVSVMSAALMDVFLALFDGEMRDLAMLRKVIYRLMSVQK